MMKFNLRGLDKDIFISVYNIFFRCGCRIINLLAYVLTIFRSQVFLFLRSHVKFINRYTQCSVIGLGSFVIAN